jgi:hypothetical protein
LRTEDKVYIAFMVTKLLPDAYRNLNQKINIVDSYILDLKKYLHTKFETENGFSDLDKAL